MSVTLTRAQTDSVGRALVLLERALSDHERAERDRFFGEDSLSLYDEGERWDLVRGARELLKLAQAER